MDNLAGIPPRMLVVEVEHWSAIAAGLDPATPAAVVAAGRITALTPAAIAAGVRTGMRRRLAQSECPALELIEHDSDLDVRRFVPVVTALEDLAPRVEVLTPGCCVVATRGPSRYYGGDEALAELVARTVAHTLAEEVFSTAGSRGASALDTAGPRGTSASGTTTVRVGVADGLFAAGTAARMAPEAGPTTRLERASEVSARVLVVPVSDSAAFLAGLSLRALTQEFSPLAGFATAGSRGVGASGTSDTVDVLWRLGLRTLGDVAALPATDLVGRFGTQGEWAHRLACGDDPRPSQPDAAAVDLSVDAEIDPPADRLDTVAFTAKSLADHLDAELARCGQALVCVEISAETENGETHSRRWRHSFRFRPADVTDRVRWQLDGWRDSRRAAPTGRISLIRLTVAHTVPDEGRQLGFWGGQSEADDRAERAVQRVQTLVGFDGVTVGRQGAGRRLGDLEQRLPFGTTATTTTSPVATSLVATSPVSTTPAGASTVNPAGLNASAPPWPGRLGTPAPAEVLAAPEPLAVFDASGEPVGVNGRGEATAPPAELQHADGRTRCITAWAGPWPLDERWWNPRTRRRQARFQFVLDDGTAHLCAIEGGCWHREATYD